MVEILANDVVDTLPVLHTREMAGHLPRCEVTHFCIARNELHIRLQIAGRLEQAIVLQQDRPNLCEHRVAQLFATLGRHPFTRGVVGPAVVQFQTHTGIEEWSSQVRRSASRTVSLLPIHIVGRRDQDQAFRKVTGGTHTELGGIHQSQQPFAENRIGFAAGHKLSQPLHPPIQPDDPPQNAWLDNQGCWFHLLHELLDHSTTRHVTPRIGDAEIIAYAEPVGIPRGQWCPKIGPNALHAPSNTPRGSRPTPTKWIGAALLRPAS